MISFLVFLLLESYSTRVLMMSYRFMPSLTKRISQEGSLRKSGPRGILEPQSRDEISDSKRSVTQRDDRWHNSNDNQACRVGI